MDGGELLKTPHAPEAEHGPLPSSEWQVRILRAIVEPTARRLPVSSAYFLEGSAVGAQFVRHKRAASGRSLRSRH